MNLMKNRDVERPIKVTKAKNERQVLNEIIK